MGATWEGKGTVEMRQDCPSGLTQALLCLTAGHFLNSFCPRSHLHGRRGVWRKQRQARRKRSIRTVLHISWTWGQIGIGEFVQDPGAQARDFTHIASMGGFTRGTLAARQFCCNLSSDPSAHDERADL